MNRRAAIVTSTLSLSLAAALLVGQPGSARAEGYWADQDRGGPSLADLFVGRTSWTQEPDDVQVSVGSSWSRALAGDESIGLGAKLAVGLTHRLQLEVEGTSSVAAGEEDTAARRAALGAKVGVIRKPHLFVAAGGRLVSTAADAAQTEADIAAGASHRRWLINLSASGGRRVVAGESTLVGGSAFAVAYAAPVTPLVEIGVDAGDASVVRTSAGASTSFGGLGVAAALGLAAGEDGGAASVGVMLSWQTAMRASSAAPTHLVANPRSATVASR
jgi:hypothetical protein